MWRIRKYSIHYRQTAVVKLTFHEEGKQPIYWRPGETAAGIMSRESKDDTMFLAWLALNKSDLAAREHLYEEIPNYYTWNDKQKQFKKRGRPGFAIGRINFVPHSIEESYHLRILINSQRGPTSFEDIKTVKGVVHKSYRDACYALGLLDDDKEYIEGIREANFWCSPKFVRRLFVIMLLSESLSAPDTVWEQTWKILSEDIQRRKRTELKQPGNICHSLIIT